ncbi:MULTISPECIES: hypothetical protein [unclassified Nocardioides]|uniref:hypothetical protein n=1 Tax=unclassified Nocardioides TaxID=2615069 RepID=UPI003615DFF9
MLKRTLATGFAAVMAAGGLVVATDVAAHADNTAISIEKAATRSATGMIMNVRVTVVCPDETTNAFVAAQVSQTNPAGGTQTATSAVISLGAFECSGNEETITIPVRRPTGGYDWSAGQAAVRNVVFKTSDPSGHYFAFLKARTVNVS